MKNARIAQNKKLSGDNTMRFESAVSSNESKNKKLAKNSSSLLKNMSLKLTLGFLVLLLTSVSSTFAQESKATADNALKSSGRVNPSTLAMELDIPIANYPGRGINVPISLSYSSKLWRMDTVEMMSTSIGAACKTYSYPLYSEDSRAGWTSSLDVPIIEYTGWSERFTQTGFPVIDRFCENQSPPPLSSPIRRITVRLPSGETHELRSDGSGSGINGYFFAADGSNIVYKEDSYNNTYKLMMPDGSYYEFENIANGNPDHISRRAVKFVDRNGNFTSYNNSTKIWTDTLGRTLESPLNDSSEGVKTYQLPGMTGTYKFHWEKLEDGLTNPSDQMKYAGDTYAVPAPAYFAKRPANETLFQSNSAWDNRVQNSNVLFNPVVLTKIELPTGQSYEFSYDLYGQIDKIKYPTGGEETFDYDELTPLTPVNQPWDDVSSQTNLGVMERNLYESASSSPYTWTYATTYVDPKGYKISIDSPEGILTERFLHRGEPGCIGCSHGTYGYGDILVGKSYEIRVFDKLGTDNVRNLVSKQLTHWTKQSTPVGVGTADWHPRMTHSENYVYDPSGNGDYVWTTSKYEYEDVSNINKPLLTKKTKQYEYQASSGGSNLIPPEQPGGDPDPNPTPIPTPVPPSSTLIKTSESTYLIYDTSITPATRDIYRNKNMVLLLTATQIKDGTEYVVSRNETKFDEATYSPAVGRGNPTTTIVWDSSKGVVTNPANYISSKAKFDNHGNQIQSIDALGNIATTTFDATHNAFPIKINTAAPGNGTNGSNTAFETENTFNVTTGLPLTSKDINGQITTFEYDPVTLRPTKVIPPTGGGVVETIYNDVSGNLWVKIRSQIAASDWIETITYLDGLGRSFKSEKVHSDGSIFVENEYYADGNLKRESNPYRVGETKLWTTYHYDDAGRKTSVVLPDGATVQTSYAVSTSGVIGTTKQVTDQAGKKRMGINDSLGRMIRVVEDPDGQSLNTDYIFDTLGNLRKTTQGEQNRYFLHDSLGRLLYSKQPEEEVNNSLVATDLVTSNTNWSSKYIYDENGNILSATNAKGITVTSTYDNFNRIILKDFSDSTSDVSYYYDGTGLATTPNYAKGKISKIASNISETRYTSFDSFGRVLTHEQRTTSGQISGTDTPYQTAYTYNLAGAMLTETYPSGRVMNYDYRQDGELDKLSGAKAGQATAKTYMDSIAYNTLGSIDQMRLGNGTWENIQYNSRQQIAQVALGHSNSDKNLLKIDYGYGQVAENNGSLRQQKINHAGLTNEIVQDYTYDDLNRLKSAIESSSNVQSWKQTFNYDRYGNREFDAANTTTLPANDKVNNPDILTSNNRLKEDQDNDSIIDYDYDKSGNVTLDAEAQRFIYDAENRIKEFFRGTNQGSTADAKYEYDGDGKRIRKVVDSTETIFVYNANGQLVAEYSNQLPTTPKVSYLTYDHLGSPRIITDGGGAVVSRHDYLAFGDEVTETVGNVAGRTNSQGYGKDDEIRKQYTGYERDKESGLDFAQARYYNPSHGRFTSVDPLTASVAIKNPQTFNRYSYVLNSPYKFVDPLGLLAQNPGDKGDCPEKPCDEEDKKQKDQNPWDKPFDPDKDRPKTPEPGTATPIDPKPIGYDDKGNPIYDENNKKAYNCHSYTFSNKEGDPKDKANKGVVRIGAKKWDNDPRNNLKKYNELKPDDKVEEGDAVIYYVDENDNDKFDKKDTVIHSAEVTQVDGDGDAELVRSKMGRDEMSTNHPNAPDYYETGENKDGNQAPTKRAYFRPKKKKD